MRGSSTPDEEKTYQGTYKPEDNVKLAIFSDDGCTVTIDGAVVWSKKGSGQALPDINNSLRGLGSLRGGQTYNIKVEYSNTVYTGQGDIDGVTLFVYEAEKEPISSMTLKRVSFSGTGGVKTDLGGYAFSSPHWNVERDGKPVNDPQSQKSFPITYKTGETAMANAAFAVLPTTAKKPLLIRGGSLFPAKECTPSNGSILYPATAAVTSLSSVIQNTDLSIAWEYSTNSGITWHSAGASTNRLYLTLSGRSGRETLLFVACAASGTSAGATQAIVDGIWGKFATLSITRIQPLFASGSNNPITAVLSYWVNQHDVDPNHTTDGLINNVDGPCSSWALFFKDALDIQNVSSQKCSIKPAWSWVPYPYPNGPVAIYEGKQINVASTTAQGNSNAPTDFNNHAVVKHSGIFYDPSY